MIIAAHAYAAGEAEGDALVLAEPLSFWGGIDVETGRVIDHSHPDLGKVISGSVLVMPSGRGSSSSASVFAESIRRGTGPAAVILATPDPILTVGALVAWALYGRRCPVLVCPIEGITTGQRLRVSARGSDAEIVDLSVEGS
jgi:predicted aconitase with swiveling domain